MSPIFDFISGKKRGKMAELEAAVEHTAGYLGVEIEENERLRAKLDQIAAVCDDNAASSCDAHMALNFIRQIAVDQKSE